LAQLYRERDDRRVGMLRWLSEEVGELAKALRTGDRADLEHEFDDVLAWLASLANLGASTSRQQSPGTPRPARGAVARCAGVPSRERSRAGIVPADPVQRAMPPGD